MGIYDDMVSIAYTRAKNLLKSHKEKKMPVLMYGLLVGAFPIKANPDAEHSHHAVIDAIHRYYKENAFGDAEEMKEFYIAGLMDLAKTIADRSVIPRAEVVFSYELEIEHDGENAFTVDMKKVLKAYGKSLKKHVKRFEKEEPGFTQKIKEGNDFFEKNYGISYWK